MSPLGARHAIASIGLALALAACNAAATPVPTTNPTHTPGSSAPATEQPTEPSATAAPSPAATPGHLDELSVTTEPWAKVPGSALSMTAPDDGTGRLFVGNQAGQVWVVNRDGSVETEPLVDLDSRIKSGGEQGLLGLAVHPAFPMDPRVFVDYTNNEGDTVIASLALEPGNPDRLEPASFKLLLFIDQPFPNHNGGSLQFGPDGYLTIAMGDGGSGGDPQGNGQNPEALLGKILRIDVDGATTDRPYGIPPENPYAKSGGAPEVWLEGMRNPWRTSFDRTNADFWIGDVGQGAWEEVDVVRAGTSGPRNFGWNVTEGFHCYNAQSCDQAGLLPPVAAYGHDQGCAVVGGYVYRGPTYPVLSGTYLFSDNCSSTIWAIDADSDGPSTPVVVGSVTGNIASFGEDANGELYALSLDGSVLKVAAAER